MSTVIRAIRPGANRSPSRGTMVRTSSSPVESFAVIFKGLPPIGTGATANQAGSPPAISTPLTSRMTDEEASLGW